MKSAALAMAGICVGVLCATTGCPSSDAPAGQGGGGSTSVTTSTTTASSTATSTTATTSTGMDYPCGLSRPASVPEGWVPWTELSCSCPLWHPVTEAQMPPPLTWDPCVLPMADGACQQMRIDWPWTLTPMGMPFFSRDDDGKALLLVTRAVDDEEHSESYQDYWVAEAEGPVRHATRRVGKVDEGCFMYASDFRENRFMFSANGNGTAPNVYTALEDSFVFGDVGDLQPRLGPSNSGEEYWSWFGGGEAILRGAAPALVLDLMAPDFTVEKQIWPSGVDPDGLPIAGAPLVVGRDVFFNVGNYSKVGIMAYDDVQKTHPLIRWYGDTSQGAANIGTDGKDLVWTHGTGKPPGESLYPTRSIMTSPYTTDANALAPKRLRSDPNADMGDEFKVGCGFAARNATSKSTLIVRLSDGVSWTLEKGDHWYWAIPLGLTCTELFALVLIDDPSTPNFEQTPTIARVKLDMLGPGTLPD